MAAPRRFLTQAELTAKRVSDIAPWLDETYGPDNWERCIFNYYPGILVRMDDGGEPKYVSLRTCEKARDGQRSGAAATSDTAWGLTLLYVKALRRLVRLFYARQADREARLSAYQAMTDRLRADLEEAQNQDAREPK